MKAPVESSGHHAVAAGFTLPAILVVTAGLLVLAVGAMLVAVTERGTARSFVDRQRAELAAGAALEEVRGILNLETSNDDFVVLQSFRTTPPVNGGEPAPHLFIARGRALDTGFSYRYVPLSSSVTQPPDTPHLTAPKPESLAGTDETGRIDFTTHPYQDKARAAWLPVKDENGRIVARYAYWIEDLQGKLDPKLAGNHQGQDLTHARAAHPFPAPGLNPAPEAKDEPALDQIALYAIDPRSSPTSQAEMGKVLVKNRSLLVSPASTLAAAGIRPPLIRNGTGRLVDVKARAAEECLAANIQPYLERPVVPFVPGISPALAGTPRMNLNAMLAGNPDESVNEMAGFIRAALPDFDRRKGGFPDDYVKTLAANAIDYADADSKPTLKPGEYRGLDACPLMSELALQINYLGISNQEDRKIMTFRFKLFAELFNPTSQAVNGDARLSYEVALPMDSIGAGVGDEPFDSPSLLSSPERSTHDLSLIDGRYWTRQVGVVLEPNQYRCFSFADVVYRIDVGSSSDYIPDGTPFSLNESRAASGLSLMWNGETVERIEGILRQSGLIYSKKNGVVTGGFLVNKTETITKAALPGHVYDDFPAMYYNMGDPRITHYLRAAPLDENAYPENSSPNRRNIRLDIYKNDVPAKTKVYARVLPSEWPDGGHNAAVGSWVPGSSDKTEMTDSKFDFAYDPQMRLAAPQVISNRGRFYSTTELGRVFDPIMHAPAFSISDETDELLGKGRLPASGEHWPDVTTGQSSPYFGGGNTLRIGRPEHPAFDLAGAKGLHAVRLLDLFHTGRPRSEIATDRTGPVIRIEGHVNLNTASRDVLRAMAAGVLGMDPLLGHRLGNDHAGAPAMAPPVSPLALNAPMMQIEADRVADAILRNRPYASTADLALVRDSGEVPVFGNRATYPDSSNIEWSDSAAEEVFARVYEGSTVRSRSFRVWIVAQTLAPTVKPGSAPEVLSEVRKVHTLFADPGERAKDGSILPEQVKTVVTSTNEF
jgi:type II secretory pathway pseudopilin PulG